MPAENLLNEAVKVAEKIASHSPLIVSLCKESVNAGDCCAKQRFIYSISNCDLRIFIVFM